MDMILEKDEKVIIDRIINEVYSSMINCENDDCQCIEIVAPSLGHFIKNISDESETNLICFFKFGRVFILLDDFYPKRFDEYNESIKKYILVDSILKLFKNIIVEDISVSYNYKKKSTCRKSLAVYYKIYNFDEKYFANTVDISDRDNLIVNHFCDYINKKYKDEVRFIKYRFDCNHEFGIVKIKKGKELPKIGNDKILYCRLEEYNFINYYIWKDDKYEKINGELIKAIEENL